MALKEYKGGPKEINCQRGGHYNTTRVESGKYTETKRQLVSKELSDFNSN